MQAQVRTQALSYHNPETSNTCIQDANTRQPELSPIECYLSALFPIVPGGKDSVVLDGHDLVFGHGKEHSVSPGQDILFITARSPRGGDLLAVRWEVGSLGDCANPSWMNPRLGKLAR